MATTVTVVTSNPGKHREIIALMAPYGITVRRISEELPEPQADSLEPVVLAKLSAASELPGWVLVEDSGIFLEGLGGFPGVYSAYAYRTLGLAGVLRLLRGRPRGAVFRTVAGLRRGAARWLTRGSVRGRVALRARGVNGFGYDPIFIPAEQNRTFAEMDATEKDRYSHRGRAIRAAARRILLEERGPA
jgi:XTP/dITP diphosphohydrolase